jgi:uncharacterized protein (DUF1810 family)
MPVKPYLGRARFRPGEPLRSEAAGFSWRRPAGAVLLLRRRARDYSPASMPEEFDVERFVKAQEPVVAQVERELAVGRKRSHWMWFVFPQLRGLGHSSMAQHYGIGSLAEACAYLAPPILGQRLLEWTALVNRVEARSANAIFGTRDDLKFRSAMTLFAAARPEQTAFRDALEKSFGGEADRMTPDLLANQPRSPFRLRPPPDSCGRLPMTCTPSRERRRRPSHRALAVASSSLVASQSRFYVGSALRFHRRFRLLSPASISRPRPIVPIAPFLSRVATNAHPP